MKTWVLSGLNFLAASLSGVLDGVALHINALTGILLALLGLLEGYKRIRNWFRGRNEKGEAE